MHPVSREELIRRLHRLGFDGPFSGGKHSIMIRDNFRLPIPDPHKGDIGGGLLRKDSPRGPYHRGRMELFPIMQTIRSFVALPATTTVRERLTEIQQELIQTLPDVKWDSPEKFHITLKFLGNVEPQLLEKLIVALRPVATQLPAFELIYQDVGAFPSITRPRVIWIGTSPNDALLSLQRQVEETCARFGFPKEDRAFHPHITLGRVKSSRNIHRLTDKLKSTTLEPTHSRCTELLVMRSDLRPAGSVYSVLKSIPFKP